MVVSSDRTMREHQYQQLLSVGRTLVETVEPERVLERLLDVARDEIVARLRLGVNAINNPSFSPDGAWLTYVTWDDSGGGHVWKLATATPRRGRNEPVRLTSIRNQYANPSFSPDGRWVAFVQGSGIVNLGGQPSSEPYLEIAVVSAEGGPVRRVTTRDELTLAAYLN